MAGQVMESHHQPRLQPPAMAFPQLQPGCKNDVHHHHHEYPTITSTMPTSTMATSVPNTTADMAAAYLQHLQDTAAAAAGEANKTGGGGAARGEQCPRCASHDTKFCYYNNYNTSQPRHFCRACRRYWTLGGSLRNVPIGGSARKRPRLAHHHHLHHSPARRAPLFVGLGLAAGGGGAPPTTTMPPPPTAAAAPQGGLLGTLFGLGSPLLEGPAAPMLEGHGVGFDLGLGLPTGTGPVGGGGNMQMQGFGLRGGGGSGGHGGASSAGLFWLAGLLDNDSVDAWKGMPGGGAGVAGAAMWPEFSAAAGQQTGGLLHGGTQLM